MVWGETFCEKRQETLLALLSAIPSMSGVFIDHGDLEDVQCSMCVGMVMISQSLGTHFSIPPNHHITYKRFQFSSPKIPNHLVF